MSDRRESIQEAEDADAAEDDEIQQQQKRNRKKKNKERESRDGFVRRLRGAKNLILLPLSKLERAYARRKSRPPPPPFPYSEDLGKGSHLCFMQPRVLDSPMKAAVPDVQTSSYRNFLRSLLERNDFYDPECNVHRDI